MASGGALACSAFNPAFDGDGQGSGGTNTGAGSRGSLDGPDPTGGAKTTTTTGATSDRPTDTAESHDDVADGPQLTTDPSGDTRGDPTTGETGGSETATPEPLLCCAAHDSAEPFPGCPGDPAVSQCVCDQMPSCCRDNWGEACVELVGKCAGAPCPQPATCCAAGAGEPCLQSEVGQCACDARPECCEEGGWDVSCAFLAAEACDGPCFVGTGDCCASTPGDVGCDDFFVQTCVCETDAYCCEGGWDSLCVASASAECGAPCDPPGDGPCCEAHRGTGCIDGVGSAGTQNCVCATLPECCDVAWTEACVEAAVGTCGLLCDE